MFIYLPLHLGRSSNLSPSRFLTGWLSYLPLCLSLYILTSGYSLSTQNGCYREKFLPSPPGRLLSLFSLHTCAGLTHPWTKEGFSLLSQLVRKDPQRATHVSWGSRTVVGNMGPGPLVLLSRTLQPYSGLILMYRMHCVMIRAGPIRRYDLVVWLDRLKMSGSGGLVTRCPLVKQTSSTRAQGWELFSKDV